MDEGKDTMSTLRIRVLGRLTHPGFALALLILGCLVAGCRDRKAEPGASSGGQHGAGAEGVPQGSPGTTPGQNPEPSPASVVCGPVKPWDVDGDGVSNATEENNAKAGYLPFDRFHCDTDPSHPVGTFYAGSLDKGVNLADRGSGYIHLRGGDPVDSDDWGSLELVACIETVGREWEATGRRIGVNDLSRRPGGKFRPHRSHQNGLDVDLRYVRKDGQDAPLDLRRNPEEYDPLATQELLRLFLDHCNVSVIFSDIGRLGFTDQELDPDRHGQILTFAIGHSNHFHLRLNPPPARSALMRGGLGWPGSLGVSAGVSAGVFAALFQPLLIQPPPTRRFPTAQTPGPRRPILATPTTQVTPVTPALSAPLLVQRSTDDRRTILRGDPATRRATALYRSSRDVVFELAVSADNRYTAALESTDGVVKEGEYVVPPRNELVILDGNGQVVRRVEADVQHYRFSPDGRKVAYLTGTYFEGGVGFQPEGVFILDIVSGATERVDAEDVYDLDWGPEEGSLMLRALAAAPERRVLRYDARSRRISAAPSGAFHLSPDGQFFLKQPDELIEEGSCQPGQKPGDCFQVFDRRTGRPASLPSRDLGQPVSWAGGEGHLLLLSKQEQTSREQTVQLGRTLVRGRLPAAVTRAESSLWDPGTAQVVRKIPGAAATGVLPGVWVGGRNQLLLDRAPEPATRSRPGLERLIVEPVRPAPPPP
jgi:penicillin-insensitive murein DD-endopeptidase